MSQFDPAALNPGDLIYMADDETQEVFFDRVFVVDSAPVPMSDDGLAEELRGRGVCEVMTRCGDRCRYSDNCDGGSPHLLLLTPDSFVMAKDVVWR